MKLPTAITVEIEFNPEQAPHHLDGDMFWYICVHSGGWDTYREAVYLSPTKPTARELRKAIKYFKQGK